MNKLILLVKMHALLVKLLRENVIGSKGRSKGIWLQPNYKNNRNWLGNNDAFVINYIHYDIVQNE